MFVSYYQPTALHWLYCWWCAPYTWSCCTLLHWPRWWQALFWSFWRIHVPLCSVSTCCMHPHKYISVDKPWRRCMAESRHMAADRCFHLHFLRANPQLASRCCVCPCGQGRCTQEFIWFHVLEKKEPSHLGAGKTSLALTCAAGYQPARKGLLNCWELSRRQGLIDSVFGGRAWERSAYRLEFGLGGVVCDCL